MACMVRDARVPRPPHHEGRGFRRESRPHPEEPASRRASRRMAAERLYARFLFNAIALPLAGRGDPLLLVRTGRPRGAPLRHVDPVGATLVVALLLVMTGLIAMVRRRRSPHEQ